MGSGAINSTRTEERESERMALNSLPVSCLSGEDVHCDSCVNFNLSPNSCKLPPSLPKLQPPPPPHLTVARKIAPDQVPPPPKNTRASHWEPARPLP